MLCGKHSRFLFYCFAQSNAQDQILVVWPTRQSATINIRIVHTMILLLTFGKPQGTYLFLQY